MNNADGRWGDQPFQLNEPAAISDVIDGEVVIMNLARGSYYGLNEIGADIWRMIMAGRTGAHIAAELAGHFGIETDRALTDVSALIAKMVEQDLLVPAEPAEAAGLSVAPIAASRYKQPDLSIYSDMKDLLAFDPPLPAYEPAAKG